jgi:hypothetical protein
MKVVISIAHVARASLSLPIPSKTPTYYYMNRVTVCAFVCCDSIDPFTESPFPTNSLPIGSGEAASKFRKSVLPPTKTFPPAKPSPPPAPRQLEPFPVAVSSPSLPLAASQLAA